MEGNGKVCAETAMEHGKRRLRRAPPFAARACLAAESSILRYTDILAYPQSCSRVTKRRPLTAAQRGGRTGRMNVRKTDEEIWLKEGLYDGDEKENKRK